jgi:hypothetical protein
MASYNVRLISCEEKFHFYLLEYKWNIIMNDGSCHRLRETNDGWRPRPAAFRDTPSAPTFARLSCVVSRSAQQRAR